MESFLVAVNAVIPFFCYLALVILDDEIAKPVWISLVVKGAAVYFAYAAPSATHLFLSLQSLSKPLHYVQQIVIARAALVVVTFFLAIYADDDPRRQNGEWLILGIFKAGKPEDEQRKI